MAKRKTIPIFERMSTEKKILMGTCLSIIFTVSILYGGISFVMFSELDFFKFTASSDFTTVLTISIICFIFCRIIKNSIDEGEIKKGKRRIRKRKPNPFKPIGSWSCPNCGFMSIEYVCSKCGNPFSGDD